MTGSCHRTRWAHQALAIAIVWLGGALTQALAQQPGFAKGDQGSEFFPFSVNEDAPGGLPDRSALNRALGPESRLFVRDARFFAAGPDGKPHTGDDVRTRLYGVNLSFGSNFPAPDDAPRLARRLRKLGMNAVRLHHMDSFPSDDRQAPGSILTTGPYPTLNQEAVARLARLIDALAAEGIYVNLNLHVGYRFRPDVDGLPQPKGPPGVAPIGNPLHVYHPRMIELQEQYARAVIRALRLRGNPALAMVEINNESSLLAAWQWRKWEYAVPGGYAEGLQALWQTWLTRRYGSTAQACDTWQICADRNQPVPLLMPADADVAQEGMDGLRSRLNRLLAKVMAYLPGARAADDTSQATSGKARRTQDFLAFLADTDKAYVDRMRALIKAETDALVPVTGTQMAYGGALNFTSHANMDYIDEHIYVGHPEFPGGGWTPRDWRMRDVAPSGGAELRRLLAMSFRRDQAKPFVVSEYSQPFPNPRGSETLPVLAAIAATQDWDGLFYFDYTFTPDGLSAPSNFSLSGDWGKYVFAGPSAQLFREGWTPVLQDAVSLPMPTRSQLAIAASPAFDALDAHVTQRLGVKPDLALQKHISMDTRPNATTTPVDAAASVSGSLSFDERQKRLVLQAPQAYGVVGDLGGTRVEAGAFGIEFLGKQGAPASLLMTSADGRPLAGSRRMLVSLGGWTTGTQQGSRPPRPKELIPYKGDRSWLTLEPDPLDLKQPSGTVDTTGPAWVARTPLRITWKGPGGRVYPLDGNGQRRPALGTDALVRQGDTSSAMLQATAAQSSLWYEIELDGPAAATRPGAQP